MLGAKNFRDVVSEGLAKARQEFASREDEHAVHDLELEVEFWLKVEECELCTKGQLCSGHYQRMYDCL